MNTVILICLVVFFLIVTIMDGSDDDHIYCTVNTKSGHVRGVQKQTLFGETSYFSFRGIPFAEPPIKNLRFKVKEMHRSQSVRW